METGETEKLYHQDANQDRFEAELIDQRKEGKRWLVILDRTAFYPEGGGQPADRGWLNQIPVLDVQEAEGRVMHHLVEPLSLGTVHGRVDWARRQDFMQQHTGQHIISASLHQRGKHQTVSTHLGEEDTTVEIDAQDILPEDLSAAEKLANRIINQNLPILIHWITPREIGRFSWRKPPVLQDKSGRPRERLRVVEIQGIDAATCGGVHLSSTGQTGLIKLVGMEKIRRRLRLHWMIGRRAYQDYGEKDRLLATLSQELSCSTEALVQGVQNLKDKLREQSRRAEAQEQRLAELTAQALVAQGKKISGRLLIFHRFKDESESLVRKVLERLLAEPKRMAALVNLTAGELRWSVGLSPEFPGSLKTILPPLLPLIEGRGGGGDSRWQGSGKNPGGVEAFLEGLRRAVAGGGAGHSAGSRTDRGRRQQHSND